ncbi:MAG: D-alanine--D-alanine ligase [Candidatus Eiseniibacteriota bacterium]|nr:MAG: D-alanine--D-alanine ligase [Candidatus Eisenbacteria bacterium]
MKIIVLMGGVSSEREVSLASGKEISKGLRTRGHEIVEVDLKDALDVSASAERSGPNNGLADFVSNPDVASAEVVFIAMHGGAGEDGTVQALLDVMGKPYTGSGMLSSALCLDKIQSKRLFERAGIPTPAWRAVGRERVEGVTEAIAALGGFPVVTKPRNQGSTIGVSIVLEKEQVALAVAEALKYSEDILVEKYIEGREMTVAVLGERPLPVIEIAPETGFYDYERKYTKGKSEYIVPAQMPEGLSKEIQAIAINAYRLLGCEDFGRVDFRLSHGGEPYCLEVNTIPGMTGTSLVPMGARAVGIEFPELLEEICRLALCRRRSAEEANAT